MMRSFILACAFAGVASDALELTSTNWDAEVIESGKAAFVKFYAPWCGHCKKLKPDWDTLYDEFKDSKTVLVADVDCTAGGKELCEKYGVRGYPTLKYFNPPDEEGEDYKGGRSLADLKKFAAENLGPGCSVDTLENCSDEQKKELDEYIAMPAETRDAKLAELKSALDDADAAHETLLKDLQAKYKTSMDDLEKLKEESSPKIKLLKAATPKAATPTADAGKDEM